MSDALLALWIALIGADRIDLAGGHGPFILTPFLALTPIVALSEMLRRTTHGQRVVVSRRAIGYAAASIALVCVAMASVFFSQEIPISASRAILLLADVTGTLVIAVLCADRSNLMTVLARGALLGLALFVVFDVVEAFSWIGRAPEIIHFGPMTFRFDELQSLGPIPRVGGPVRDSNRAGFVLTFYAVAIAAGTRRGWLRRSALTLAVLFLAATISRSATLGALATFVVAVITVQRGVPLRALATGAMAAALLAAVWLVNPAAVRRVTLLVSSPISERLSASEGSAQSHLELIERGVQQGTESVPRAAIGLGYGNSYLALQDVFPGNKYGNFHSLYVTMFAESGIFALLLTLLLMGAPLVFGGPWRALVAGSVAFNVFYQTTTEPVFWFVLALAWLTMQVPLKTETAHGKLIGSRGGAGPRSEGDG